MSFAASKKGLLARRAALEVLLAVAAGAYADVAVDRVFKRYSLSAVDKSLAMELSYGSIRQRYLLDCWLDCYGKVPARKQPPELRWLLHLGLYQLLNMERIPSGAAVDTSVDLAKVINLHRLAPVVNGLLRSVLRAKEAGISIPLPSAPAERLAQLHSFPIWLAQYLISWKGVDFAENFAKASNQVPPLDLRINRLHASVENVKQGFDTAGLESAFIDGCPDGLHVQEGNGDLRTWPGFEEGLWCVQDRVAQLIAPLLAPHAGDRVLDACAAPGGKTTHLVELMQDCGELWAVDRSKERLRRLSANAARLGECKCLNLLVADASSLLEIKPSWHKSFDKILLDAPCSGLGTLSMHPDARWRMSPEKIEKLVSLQNILLEGLLPLLKPGGQIVYSTCTIHPHENEDQIKNLIKNHPELILKHEHHFWPDFFKPGDGFYAAVMEVN